LAGVRRREGAIAMTETPQAQPYDWHPMRKTWSFSDYGEWLDEGTTALIEDIGTRSEATSDGHVAVSVPASELPIDVIHDHDQHSYGAWFGPAQIGYLSYRLVGLRGGPSRSSALSCVR
jgi:hypothetical protein